MRLLIVAVFVAAFDASVSNETTTLQTNPTTLQVDLESTTTSFATESVGTLEDETTVTTENSLETTTNYAEPSVKTDDDFKMKSDRRIDAVQHSSGGPNVLQVLRNLRASTFVQLLISTRLDLILENAGPFTVFAPTDDAFNRLPRQIQKHLQGDLESLRQLLYYHIIPGVHESQHLRNELVLTTLAKVNASAIVRIYADKKPTINSAALTVPDARASNGIVHIVSDVMYPVPQGSIMSTIRSCPMLKTLVRLLDESGVAEKLETSDIGVTLFAPSEEAFHFFTTSQNEEYSKNKTILRDILLNHVVPGTYFSGSLRDNQALVNAAEIDIHVGMRHGKLTEVGYGRVLASDIPAKNGVVHVIDRVLHFQAPCFYP